MSSPAQKAGTVENQIATVTILGVKVHCVDFQQTLAHLGRWIERSAEQPLAAAKVRQICTVNPEFIMAAQRDPVFADVLRNADLCVPDGSGVLWAARRQGIHLTERVTGSDGIYHICQRAATRGWTVFLLGAAPGVAEAAAQRLCTLYPGLQVVGSYSGSPQAASWPTIAEQLEQARPDILFVAYGHPQQDLWIARHRHELPVKVALGVGGAFDFVAGITPRAPRWMQRWGIEWLFRLIQQPWRWRRMATLPLFVRAIWRG